MEVVCHIRYEIDPFRQAQFEEYARNWLSIIPACGGEIIGYFMPHEGTNYEAHALIGFASLAAYEATAPNSGRTRAAEPISNSHRKNAAS